MIKKYKYVSYEYQKTVRMFYIEHIKVFAKTQIPKSTAL